MTSRRTHSAFVGDIGKSAESRPDVPARREPDAATSKVFSSIHRGRERFSATAVGKAFAKVKAPSGKIG